MCLEISYNLLNLRKFLKSIENSICIFRIFFKLLIHKSLTQKYDLVTFETFKNTVLNLSYLKFE